MKRRFVTAISIVAVCLAAEAMAETPSPYPIFTFKRVGVPSKGTSNRIKVQIAPADQLVPVAAATDATAPATPDKTPVLTGLEWYWLGVSPKLADSGPSRLRDAVLFLDKAPAGKAVPTPRLQQMQDIAKAHGTEILKATIGTDVSPALVLAVIGIESAGNSGAVSGAGATGLMQLMPDTAKRFGVKDSTIATQNIKGGVAYLDWLMKKFDNDPVMVLASYNAGEGAVQKHGGVPPYAETRAYVPKVLAAWTVARGLCLTPPELVTDGCVFAIRSVASK
ncbi:MAG: lytic transglycosylase domain-containing protein [Marinosulfonomonas sp.]|nr:lytic transglycosylase domain-containing protein [Marinosulfonomonas sp.]